MCCVLCDQYSVIYTGINVFYDPFIMLRIAQDFIDYYSRYVKFDAQQSMSYPQECINWLVYILYGR